MTCPAYGTILVCIRNLLRETRVAAGACGFLTLIQVFDGPSDTGASSFATRCLPASVGTRRRALIYLNAEITESYIIKQSSACVIARTRFGPGRIIGP